MEKSLSHRVFAEYTQKYIIAFPKSTDDHYKVYKTNVLRIFMHMQMCARLNV